MFRAIIIAATILTACATGKYDRAMRTCNTKCYPQVAVGVEYNYSNNRYDKCVCTTEYNSQKE